ncbi:MAG: hypothetical protein G01um101456_345 [Parcubacteria group bacterium Gr01-1014_56]|nr:MAG: hypothetical protein G01um101456_345 [Parcubacteria group bacterium Gr01-1014_56]
MSNLTVFWTVYIVLQGLWIVGAIAAWSNNMLTAGQMKKSGINAGLPYLQHYGCWNDSIVIHLWVAVVFAEFGPLWASVPVGFLLVFCVAVVLSWWANWMWVQGSMRQAHGRRGKLTAVGYLHIPQMAIILVAITMMAVWILMGQVEWWLAWGSICLVLAHVCMGWHWPLRLFQPEWCPDELEYDWTTPVFAIGYAVLMAAALLFFSLHFLSPV